MAESIDYKKTVNLPKTDFPMKANLPQNEPQMVESWQEQKTYQKMLSQNKDAQLFTMPDGPPYANGNIHLGHVLNKVLKDIVVKYKNISGRQAHFIPGWDCHGLPIELKVTKALGKKKKDMSDEEIRQLCRQEALKWVDTQREQFKRLGILADWENPYLTLQPEYEAEEVRVLAKILDNGILVRGEKPVFWCPALQTALAAAEVEYHDHKSPSIYVKFEAKEVAEKLGLTDKKLSLVIWTTTPWTLPANYAIALGEKIDYAAYEVDGEYLVIAKELKESLEQVTEKSFKEVKSFKATEVEKLNAQHPFIDRQSLLILGSHVTLDAGTGCVHTAPGHGMDDYIVGLKYGLPVSSPVDPAGRYTDEFAEMQGIKIWDANPMICEKLVKSGHMLTQTEVMHRTAYNPRSNTPLIYRATPQWFIKMDDENYPLRQKALNAAEKDIEFVPAWGSQRLNAMLSNSPDWCVSRQRLWGVPIPVFYCNDCGEALMSSELMYKIADLMESSGKGIDAYFSSTVEELIGSQECAKCSAKSFKKGTDILDVWFDSGVCHSAVQAKRDGLDYPADIYLEGSDQHRGWFQTSLVSSLASHDKIPFNALITHGFVNDSKGHKMSKSKGNVIDPADVMKKYGAEILRLWVAYEDYGQDVNISNEMFQRVTETYRRIRNTTRFLLGNLNDFNPTTDSVTVKDMPILDQWALSRLNTLIADCKKHYENYNFYKVYHALNSFYTVELSATYLDILKDRLYTAKADGVARRSSQTVIHHMLESLVTVMSPILSFLAEEVYSYLPGKKQESVFATSFPETNSEWSNPKLEQDFKTLLEIRSEVSQELEKLRADKTIGSSLDAKVKLEQTQPRIDLLDKYANILKEFFIVSGVEYSVANSNSVSVEKADGEKCVRCWHYSIQVGRSNDHPEICEKCVEALS